MKKIKIPEFLPEYKIEETDKTPFAVKWQELMGWFLIPKMGEKICWGIYDMPSRKCDYVYDMAVTGKAMVHEIEGVEICAQEFPYSKPDEISERKFIAQLTDTHCRYLATSYTDNGTKYVVTFLDGEHFSLNWGFGEDNCGNETDLRQKGIIKKEGNTLSFKKQDFLLDVVGRYDVSINGRVFDTICAVTVDSGSAGIITENFIDQNGRTVLFRRFNKDDWKIDRYKKPWSELLPQNEQMVVNGETYVHWYDCVSDYVM